jgi:hypothetical protein
MLSQTSERSFSPVGCVLRDGRETISGRCFDIWEKSRRCEPGLLIPRSRRS